MLKAHQACIDLEKNVLRIQNREVKFLSEHELPDKARHEEQLPEGASYSDLAAENPTSIAGSSGSSSNPAPTPFPGGGHTLGANPSSRPSQAAGGGQRPPSSRHPEQAIRTLMDLGVTREVAISTLDAAGGNVDVAASLLF